jgi:large repetitive protein
MHEKTTDTTKGFLMTITLLFLVLSFYSTTTTKELSLKEVEIIDALQATNFQNRIVGAIVVADTATDVDFALDSSPGTIRGTVTATTGGAPISGAIIEVFDGPLLIAFTLTDTGGHYRITGFAPDSYDIEAAAATFQDDLKGAIITANATTDCDFSLASSPGTISGTITVTTGGAAISSALVEVFKGPLLVAFQLTDASGNYSISGLAPESYDVEAQAANYQDKLIGAIVTAGNTTSGVNMSLDSSPGTISGTVTATTGGAAISGATIEVFSGPILVGFQLTDVNGNYAITGLAVGSYDVEAQAPNYQDKLIGAIVTAGATIDEDFSLDSDPGTISGTVTDTDDDAIQGALIEVFKGPVLVAFQLTDQSGNYKITGLAPETYTVEATATDYQDKLATAIVTVNTVTDQDFSLSGDPGTLSGTITSEASGEVIPSATIEIYIYQGTTLVSFGITDISGNYQLTGLAPGTYTIEALAPTFQDGTKTAVVIANTTTDCDLALKGNPATITGTIISSLAFDKSIGITVEVFDGDTSIAFTLTDENGKFSITGLPNKTLTVKALDIPNPNSDTPWGTESVIQVTALSGNHVVDFLNPKAVPPPASDFTVTKVEDHFGIFSNTAAVVTWTKASSDVHGYTPKRCGDSAAATSADGTVFHGNTDDHLYCISSSNVIGSEVDSASKKAT